MKNEIARRLENISNKYHKEINKLREIENPINDLAWEIERRSTYIETLEGLINRKRVDFEEKIKFHSLKRDREYTRPIQDIELELNNVFTVETIKKFLQEQLSVLKSELQKKIADGMDMIKKHESKTMED